MSLVGWTRKPTSEKDQLTKFLKSTDEAIKIPKTTAIMKKTPRLKEI